MSGAREQVLRFRRDAGGQGSVEYGLGIASLLGMALAGANTVVIAVRGLLAQAGIPGDPAALADAVWRAVERTAVLLIPSEWRGIGTVASAMADVVREGATGSIARLGGGWHSLSQGIPADWPSGVPSPGTAMPDPATLLPASAAIGTMYAVDWTSLALTIATAAIAFLVLFALTPARPALAVAGLGGRIPSVGRHLQAAASTANRIGGPCRAALARAVPRLSRSALSLARAALIWSAARLVSAGTMFWRWLKAAAPKLWRAARRGGISGLRRCLVSAHAMAVRAREHVSQVELARSSTSFEASINRPMASTAALATAEPAPSITATSEPQPARRFVRVRIEPGSEWLGMTIDEVCRRLDGSAVAFSRSGGPIRTRPSGAIRLREGDTVSLVCAEAALARGTAGVSGVDGRPRGEGASPD